MRIVWVSPHCWPDYVLREDGLGVKSQGGQTLVMYHGTIALAESRDDLEVDIYARYEDGEPLETRIHPRVRIIRLPLGPSDTYFPKEQFWGAPIAAFVVEVVRYAKDKDLRYDLLHGHYADGWYVAHRLSREWGVPFLCTTHSLGIRKRDNALRTGQGSLEELDRRYNFSARIDAERRALHDSARICPLTIEEGKYISEKYGTDAAKVRVINNGVVVDSFYPPNEAQVAELRAKLGLGPDDLPVLLVARVDPRKGQRELIDAAPLVMDRVRRKSGKNVKLLFVAWVESELARSLEQRVGELGIRDDVIFHPPVLNEDIPPFFWTSAVYALSSSYDIFPIVMLEAMASGRPIVATKNGGPSEIITHGEDGYLVEPTDREELATALVNILQDDDERERLGRNAHRKVVERYTWERIAGRTMEVYREVLQD
jgi:glycosyltransferase involved in cell wall biosynthesis